MTQGRWPDGRAALLCVALLWALVLLLGGPGQLGNDDAHLRLMAAGWVAPDTPPDRWIFFMHPWLGRLLAALYTTNGTLPWHDGLLTGLQLLATWGLAREALAGRRGAARAAVGLLVIAVMLPMTVVLHFTVVATVCGGAGLLWGSRALQSQGASAAWWLLAGAAMSVAGALVRPRGAWLGAVSVAIALSPAAFAWARGARKQRQWVAAGLLVALACGYAGINRVAMRAYNKDPEWGTFIEYNRARSKVTEFAAGGGVDPQSWAQLREENGWRRNDAWMLRHWLFVDREVFSLERMQRAAETLEQARPPIWEPARLPQVARSLGWLVGQPLTWAALLLVALGALMGGGRRLWWWLPLAGFVALQVAIAVAFKIPPKHVLWGSALLFALVPVGGNRRAGAVPHWQLAVLIALLAATAVQARGYVAREEALSAAVQADVKTLVEGGVRAIVVSPEGSEHHHLWRPFRAREAHESSGAAKVRWIVLGAGNGTPMQRRQLEALGHKDPFVAACARPDVVLVARADAVKHIRRWLAERRGLVVRFERVASSLQLSAWRCLTPVERPAVDTNTPRHTH